jgi:hypothetical protein
MIKSYNKNLMDCPTAQLLDLSTNPLHLPSSNRIIKMTLIWAKLKKINIVQNFLSKICISEQHLHNMLSLSLWSRSTAFHLSPENLRFSLAMRCLVLKWSGILVLWRKTQASTIRTFARIVFMHNSDFRILQRFFRRPMHSCRRMLEIELSFNRIRIIAIRNYQMKK